MKSKGPEGAFGDAGSFRTQVRMAAVQVAGLGAGELAQALAYEVEPLSGIPAAEAELEFRPVAEADPTVRVYEVAVRRKGAAAAGEKSARWVPFAYAFAALAIAALAADRVALGVRASRLRTEIARRAPLDVRVKAERAAERKARDEARRLRESREAAGRAQRDAAGLRAAYPDALAVLASACGDRAVLKEIVSKGPFTFGIRAVAVSAESAAAVMSEMTAAAAERGWRFRPGRIDAAGSSSTAVFEGELGHD